MAKKVTKKVAKKVAKKEPKQRPAKKAYTFTINVNNVGFTARTNSIREAIDRFIESDVFPFGAKTGAFITVSKGKATAHYTLYPARARRLMLSLRIKDTARDGLARDLERIIE